MTTYRSQIETLLATGAYPGDAEAAEMVGCSVITAEDYRQCYQRANGTQHENKSGIMPRDAVDFIFELRSEEGLEFKQIAQLVNEIYGELYGIRVTTGQCGNVYRQHGYKKPEQSRNIDYLGTYDRAGGTLVPRYTFPIPATIGTMYGLRIRAPRFPRTKANKYKETCDFCPHYEQCRQIGSVCRCETVWESEVL